MDQAEKSGKKVSLVLSGGGARGMAHIGVIQELLRRGYQIHAVAGCSIGAVVGAMLAMGKLDEFLDFLSEDGANIVFSQLDFTFSEHGFIKGQKLLESFQKFAPDCLMEELPVRLTIVATDMNTGRDVVYEKGSVYQAIRASVAIPAVITSVHHDGQWLVDGGVVNPLPLNLVRRQPGDYLFAVNLYASPVFADASATEKSDSKNMVAKVREKWEDIRYWRGSLINTLFDDRHQSTGYLTTLRLMSELASKRLAENMIRMVPADLLVEIPIASCGLFHFDKVEQLVLLGRRKCVVALDAFEAGLQTVSQQKEPGMWHFLSFLFKKKNGKGK